MSSEFRLIKSTQLIWNLLRVPKSTSSQRSKKKTDSFVEWKKGIAYFEADGSKALTSLIRREKDGRDGRS